LTLIAIADDCFLSHVSGDLVLSQETNDRSVVPFKVFFFPLNPLTSSAIHTPGPKTQLPLAPSFETLKFRRPFSYHANRFHRHSAFSQVTPSQEATVPRLLYPPVKKGRSVTIATKPVPLRRFSGSNQEDRANSFRVNPPPPKAKTPPSVSETPPPLFTKKVSAAKVPSCIHLHPSKSDISLLLVIGIVLPRAFASANGLFMFHNLFWFVLASFSVVDELWQRHRFVRAWR